MRELLECEVLIYEIMQDVIKRIELVKCTFHAWFLANPTGLKSTKNKKTVLAKSC